MTGFATWLVGRTGQWAGEQRKGYLRDTQFEILLDRLAAKALTDAAHEQLTDRTWDDVERETTPSLIEIISGADSLEFDGATSASSDRFEKSVAIRFSVLDDTDAPDRRPQAYWMRLDTSRLATAFVERFRERVDRQHALTRDDRLGHLRERMNAARSDANDDRTQDLVRQVLEGQHPSPQVVRNETEAYLATLIKSLRDHDWVRQAWELPDTASVEVPRRVEERRYSTVYTEDGRPMRVLGDPFDQLLGRTPDQLNVNDVAGEARQPPAPLHGGGRQRQGPQRRPA